MGIFDYFKRSTSTGSLSQYNDFWYNIFGTTSGSQVVNTSTAMRLAAFYSCVTLIAETIGNLPLNLYRTNTDGSKVAAKEHPLYDILHLQPNPDMTSMTWRETGQGHILTEGNKYSFIQRNRLGIKALYLIEPKDVTLKRLNTGRLIYKIKNDPREFSQRDILHVPGFGFNGLVGESVVSNFARLTVGNGLSLDEFMSNYFEGGILPSGVFETDGTLGENANKFKLAVKNMFSGKKKNKNPMVLEKGMTFKPFEVKLVDAQFLELAKANKIDICGIFKVPPSKIAIHGANTNYNNTEQENKSFLDTTMLPWIKRDEQSYETKLLTVAERKAGYFIRYNLDALLRPDAKTRAEIRQIDWGMGVPLNTMREKEDLAPVDGGDVGRVPLNYVEVGLAEQVQVPSKETNSRELRASGSNGIKSRDRIAGRYSPLLESNAQKVVRIEYNAISRKIKKLQRNSEDMETFLRSFYDEFPAKVKSIFGPTFRSFAESIQESVALEIGADIGMTDDLDKRVEDYIDGFVRQYIQSSLGQTLGELKESMDAVQERVTEWSERRPEKVSFNESQGLPNMIARAVFVAAGLSLVWRIRGSETCPYCRTLNGDTVAGGQGFIKAGESITVDGRDDPMVVTGLTKYPPLHQGCDCYIGHS